MTAETKARAGKAPADDASSSIVFVDADVHCSVRSFEQLFPYLPDVWQRYVRESGHAGPGASWYPKMKPFASREDAHPPGGGKPGSDLAFMQSHHLDPWKIDRAVMNPLYAVDYYHNADLAAALCAAHNDFFIEHWYEKDDRMRGSIAVPWRDPPLAVREIERVGGHPRVVQIILSMTAGVLYGQRPFHPIWAAAQTHGLVVGIHWGGMQPPRAAGDGVPSYYMEYHVTQATAAMCHIASFVCEGAFQKFPGLKLAVIEGGMAWLPALMWRMDKDWRGCRMEVPWLTEPPSEIIRRHVRLSTQPIEEPEDPAHLLQTIEHMGSDEMLMFATDYPHWDFDAPTKVLPPKTPEALRRRIFRDNAVEFYGLQ